MSDFSIRNRIEPEKINIQNQEEKVDNNQKTYMMLFHLVRKLIASKIITQIS